METGKYKNEKEHKKGIVEHENGKWIMGNEKKHEHDNGNATWQMKGTFGIKWNIKMKRSSGSYNRLSTEL